MLHSHKNFDNISLSSKKYANYRTYYSTHPENEGNRFTKNLLYEAFKKIYLPVISIKNNLKFFKRDNSEMGEFYGLTFIGPPLNKSKVIVNFSVCICMHKIK